LVHIDTSDLDLKKMKIIFLSFKKIKKCPHAANYLSNQRAKNLVQILYILRYTKMTNV
jgi:hypothetical protein